MTQPTVNLLGRIERFTTKAVQTDEGPKITTRVVLDVSQISGDLEELVGYTADITIAGLQARFGEKDVSVG
jgi:hypothetical protein